MAPKVLIFSDDLTSIEYSLIYFFMHHDIKFEHVGKFTNKKRYSDLRNFFVFCENIMDILRNFKPEVVIFDRNSKYGEAIDLISMCKITPVIFYYENGITTPDNQLLKKRTKHPELPTKKHHSNFSQAQSLIKNIVENENKNLIIQTDAEFPPAHWFEHYTFFVARYAKRPIDFLMNELHSLDVEITMERQQTAEIMKNLVKLEYRSTWVSWTKFFRDAGIKLGAMSNLEIHNG